MIYVKRSLILLIGCLMWPSFANAGSLPKEARALIDQGIEAYKAEGARAGLQAWLRGGPLETSKQALTYAASFSQIEAFFGDLVGYSIPRTKKISDTTVLACAVINYRNGPVFARYTLYRREDGSWIISSFGLNTDVDQAWPASLLCGD